MNGPLFLAADKQARGGVLSGTGAMITIALLEKTKPQPSVAAAVKTVLGLFRPEDADELNLFHPMANMAQLLVDTTDTVHYLGYVIAHPRPGFPPKSIYQTEGIGADGIGDSYAPPHGIEVASTALGLPRQAPGVHPLIESAFSGLGDVTVPAGLRAACLRSFLRSLGATGISWSSRSLRRGRRPLGFAATWPMIRTGGCRRSEPLAAGALKPAPRQRRKKDQTGSRRFNKMKSKSIITIVIP